MSDSANQTRLSLRLRKRTQERSEDSLPINRKQAKIITEETQLRHELPAFGAPMEEERKITKRSTNLKPSTTDEAPTKKQNTRQTNIKEIMKLSPPPTTGQPSYSKTVEIDSADTKPTAADKATEQHEALTTENPETHTAISTTSPKTATPTETMTSTKVTTAPCQKIEAGDQLLPSTPHSPSQSPILEHSPTEEHDLLLETSSRCVSDIGSLPSPNATPEMTRVIKATATTTAPLSPSTVFGSLSPKSQVTGAISPSVHGKSLLPKLEKERIADERATLDKLVTALDITLTFHAARNVAAFFHKIQPMLRNSTNKNVTISHLCKILFLAPGLYDVETKLLKEYGKEVEAHQVCIGHDWKMPLSGKVIQERKDLMTERSGVYYEEHKEANARIPELELPKLDKVVDKKKWLEKAKLPDRVRSILELQEKRKAAKEEKASQPRIEPTGTAKDRAKALLDRIRNKQKK